MIRVEEVWDIGCYIMVKTMGLKTLDTVAIKEYNKSGAACLITICYSQNTLPSSISNLILYGAGNIIQENGDTLIARPITRDHIIH